MNNNFEIFKYNEYFILLNYLPLFLTSILGIYFICNKFFSYFFKNNNNNNQKNINNNIISLSFPISNILNLMNNTPLIYIKSLSQLTGYNIYAKCEYLLPFTSKDRVIKNIIFQAEKNGKLTKNSVIYEGSSGSTGYSVANISRLFGYKCVIVIPDDCSNEKINLLKTTGCKLIITKQCPFSNFKDNYIRLAKKLSKEDENGFYINQFFNPINYQTHYNETGPEIYNQLNGKIDGFVSAGGTGGTIKGISKFLKEKNPDCVSVLADISGSGMYEYIKNGVMYTKEESEANRKKERYYSKIEGIGINFLSENFKEVLCDEAYKVSDDEAIFMGKYILDKEGIFIGGSSAVNFVTIYKMFLDKENKKINNIKKNSNIVTIIYDNGIKYLDKLYDEEIIKNCTVKKIEDIKL